jgi:predicted transposase YdaD
LEESRTTIEKWAYFFKHAPEVDPDKLEEITEDYPPIGHAYQVLSEFNYTKEEMDEYYRLDRNADSIRSNLLGAERRGKAEGLAEGEAKGKAEATRDMVMRFHQQGVDKNIIATAAQVSLQEVEQILAEACKN